MFGWNVKIREPQECTPGKMERLRENLLRCQQPIFMVLLFMVLQQKKF